MKHGENRRSVSSKTFVVMLALVLALGCAVGGTIAWLTAQTPEVKNTFTYGNINIELNETKPVNRQAKIVPGQDIEKDPTVKVLANSEACWLFVKVEAAGTFVKDKVTYDIAAGWTKLEDGVYYREVNASDANQDFYVLKDNKVTVSPDLTKDDIKDITAENQPTLSFTAYAIQKEGFADVAKAWEEVSKSATPVVPGA